MDKMISDLSNYFATNGSFADAVAFSQLVAGHLWGEVAKLYQVIQGSV
jgi:hypothetical protein